MHKTYIQLYWQDGWNWQTSRFISGLSKIEFVSNLTDICIDIKSLYERTVELNHNSIDYIRLERKVL